SPLQDASRELPMSRIAAPTFLAAALAALPLSVSIATLMTVTSPVSAQSAAPSTEPAGAVSAPPASATTSSATAAATPARPSMPPDQAREEYAYTLGVQAYLYGYPSVEMYRVRHHAVFDTSNPTRTPINQFRHRHELLDPNATTVVAPNNDTLYSSA